VLRLGSTVVAQYEEGTNVDSVLSPRPYLDAVISRAGTPLSVTEPTDHPHHLGVSLAIADVNGTSYWGGRTYVRGEGSIMVPNHGRQRRDRLHIDGHSLDERLSWVDEHGTTQLVEVRELRSAELAGGWALRWRSHLKATLDAITFGSPATNGRDGAGYGGIFWRFAPEIARVFSPAGDTEREVHGAATDWLAFTFPERGTTVVLTQGEERLPWFVRFAEYLGAGPSVAWDQPRTIPEGGELNLELTAYVLDDELADAAAVEAALPALRAEAGL
jgi:LacI family transcriptional regulator